MVLCYVIDLNFLKLIKLYFMKVLCEVGVICNEFNG